MNTGVGGGGHSVICAAQQPPLRRVAAPPARRVSNRRFQAGREYVGVATTKEVERSRQECSTMKDMSQPGTRLPSLFTPTVSSDARLPCSASATYVIRQLTIHVPKGNKNYKQREKRTPRTVRMLTARPPSQRHQTLTPGPPNTAPAPCLQSCCRHTPGRRCVGQQRNSRAQVGGTPPPASGGLTASGW